MKRIFTGLVVVVLLLATSINVYADSTDKAQITNLVKSYIQFRESFHVFPTDKIDNDKVDDATIQSVINGKKATLLKFIEKDTPFYKKESEMLSSVIKEQQPKQIRSFEGHATDITVTSMNLNGTTANVDVSYVAHATFGQWQKDHWVKVTPSNTILLQLYLNKDQSGSWYIFNEKWAFAPGSEP